MRRQVKPKPLLSYTLAGIVLWPAFLFVVLGVLFCTIWTLRLDVYFGVFICANIVFSQIFDRAVFKPYRCLLAGIAGATIGGLAALAVDLYLLPATGYCGIFLLHLAVCMSAFGCAFAILVENALTRAKLPTLTELITQMVRGSALTMPAFAVLAPVSVVLFGFLGVAGVHVGMAAMQVHLQSKADVPALRTWMSEQSVDSPEISKDDWPETLKELKPTRVAMVRGRLRLDFCYSRMDDYTFTLKRPGESANWCDQWRPGYHEH